MKASTATPEIASDAQVMAGMGYHAWLFASALGSPGSRWWTPLWTGWWKTRCKAHESWGVSRTYYKYAALTPVCTCLCVGAGRQVEHTGRKDEESRRWRDRRSRCL